MGCVFVVCLCLSVYVCMWWVWVGGYLPISGTMETIHMHITWHSHQSDSSSVQQNMNLIGVSHSVHSKWVQTDSNGNLLCENTRHALVPCTVQITPVHLSRWFMGTSLHHWVVYIILCVCCCAYPDCCCAYLSCACCIYVYSVFLLISCVVFVIAYLVCLLFIAVLSLCLVW